MNADEENVVYIALGSNLGDSVGEINSALEELGGLPSTRVVKTSGLFHSAPMGPQDQPDFVNAVCALETQLSPEALLMHLQSLEEKHGRVRGERWGPRTLDLDIVLYGDDVINTPDLTIPHVGLKEREFVLVPLLEVAPDLVLPTGESVQSLLYNLTHE